MQIVHSDAVFRVEPGTTPDYSHDNPLLRLLDLTGQIRLAAGRQCYLTDHLQYLVPYDFLELYGPGGADADVLDPTRQDSKTDFQKQNVRTFRTTDTQLVRGWAAVDGWVGPFVRLSYRGGPDSRLSELTGHRLGDRIKVWARVGGGAGATLTVPYNPESDRYEIELWADPGGDLRDRLDERGRQALDRGELVVRGDLVRGSPDDFTREALSDRYAVQVAADSAMHPVLPLHVELAWAELDERVWDSLGGGNYHYEFNMVLRGWDNYLGVGISPNPHGGVGFLEYRNLMSNYGRYAGIDELGRRLEPWNFDAFGRKQHAQQVEDFFSVDYMDLHLINPDSGVGLHRHRDNQEIFLMTEGRGLMVVGDWCKTPSRERCFEIRTLRAGHFAMLKGGNLHAVMNPSDRDIALFMFGGYD